MSDASLVLSYQTSVKHSLSVVEELLSLGLSLPHLRFTELVSDFWFPWKMSITILEVGRLFTFLQFMLLIWAQGKHGRTDINASAT